MKNGVEGERVSVRVMRGISYGLEGKSGSAGPLECTAGNKGEIDST